MVLPETLHEQEARKPPLTRETFILHSYISLNSIVCRIVSAVKLIFHIIDPCRSVWFPPSFVFLAVFH